MRGLQLFVLAVALLPVLLLQIGIYWNWLGMRRAAEMQANVEVARGVAAAFDAYVRDVSRQELAIGLTLTMSSPPGHDEATRILAANTQLYPSVRDFSWVNPQGQVVASDNPAAVGKDLGTQPGFRSVLNGQEWAVSDLLEDWQGEGPAFLVTRAVRDGAGTLEGVVVAAVNPQGLDTVLGIPRSGSGAISLIDRTGRGVYRYPQIAMTWEQRNWLQTDPSLGQALAGEEQDATFVSRSDGQRRVAARTTVPSIGWVASASRPADEILAPVLQGFARDAALLLLVAAAVIILALAVGRNLTGPIARLREQATALAKGKHDQRVEVSGPTELRDLGQAFNLMAFELQAKEEQQMSTLKSLRETNRRLVEANDLQQRLATNARRAEERLQARERQQAAVAELGQKALSTSDLPSLMNEAVELVARTLDLEYAKVLELLPGGDRLLLVAGVGWKEGYAGNATVDAGADLQAGYTLMSHQPVVVEDLSTESRFRGSALLQEHGVVSGVSVIIHGDGGPYGVLEAHSTQQRHFNQDDVSFVQAVANVLASAVRQRRIEEDLRSSKNQLEVILQGIADGITVQAPTGDLVYANDAAARVLGFTSAEELMSTPVNEVMSRFRVSDENGTPSAFGATPRENRVTWGKALRNHCALSRAHNRRGAMVYPQGDAGIRRQGLGCPRGEHLSGHHRPETLRGIPEFPD